MRSAIATVFGGIFILFICGRADALNWTTQGNACIPIDDTVQADKYDVGAADAKLRTSVTGTAIFMCPINDTSRYAGLPWNFLDIYYNDGGANTSIVVYFRELTMGSTSASTIVTCTSEDTGTGKTTCDFSDFTPASNKFYWFEVQINRTSGSAAAEFVGIDLT